MDETRLKKKWLEEDEAAVEAALGALLQHAHGRQFLWWLLTIGKVGHQPFSLDAFATAFACGELNVGQQVLSRITAFSPQGYVDMMKEMADARTKRDSELTAARDTARRGDPADGDPDADPA